MEAYLKLYAALFAFYAVLRYCSLFDQLTRHPCWAGTVWDAMRLRQEFDHDFTLQHDSAGDGFYWQWWVWLECGGCGLCSEAGPEDFPDYGDDYHDGWRD